MSVSLEKENGTLQPLNALSQRTTGLSQRLNAATFTNYASIQVSDPGSSLTSTSGAFTVSCWFRISIPSSLMLSNMDILMDRTDGNEAANFSYLLRYNYANNAIEFTTHGSSGSYSKTLIQSPYLERWYHVAVTRSGSSGIGIFTAYVDGRALSPFNDPAFVGNTTGAGLAIGGINGNSRQFYGEIIEAAIYNTALQLGDVQNLRFADARSLLPANLKGYYKLGYSTNAADFYRNFVTTPPTGTNPAVKVGAGNIGFEPTDQAGEQSTFDSRKNHGDDALAPLSGAFVWQQTALARAVPGIAFDFRFGYSGGTPTGPSPDGAFDPYDKRTLGLGWRQTFDARIFIESLGSDNTEFKLMSWDGSIDTWTRSNSLATVFSTRSHEYRGELVLLPNVDAEWTTPERLIYRFRNPTASDSMAGRLLQIRDFNSNSVQLLWDEGASLLTNVVDTAGGSYQFNYDSTPHLTNVTFGQWQVNFAYDPTNRLISKSLTNSSGLYAAVNTTWQFHYGTNGLLARIIDPRGNTNTFVQYDQYGRKINEMDAINRATTTRYGVPGNRQITRIDPGTNSWVETYDRKGHILAQQDPLSHVTSYTYDTNGNRTSLTEPLGWTTLFGYDSRANVIARTNALGEITRWNFHPFFNKATNEINSEGWTNNYVIDDARGNLLRHFDALGTLVSYTYWSNGLVQTSTDANGNTTRFGYDTIGFLISRTDPANNTTTFQYNDLGWKASEQDALFNWTDYDYDLNGNVVRVTDPLFRRFYRTYDGNGNLIAISDAKGKFSTNFYDGANQKFMTVDRAGNTSLFSYTSRGKLNRTTNALGHVTSYFYDAANRLTNVTDALTNSAVSVFDANGNPVAMIDPLGQRWTRTFDRLNRVVAESDPLGNTRQTTYDVVGRIRQITTPNGYPSLHAYDGRGRLTNWVDAENSS